MTEKRWSYSGGVIVGTDICENGIPHTNRSVVTHLNRYEREIEKLKEENEQLKQSLHNKMDSDAYWEKKAKQRVEELEKKKEQLKLQLDYIQSSITEAIKHSKTELEQKSLKKVIENYNEYMLGHKEVSE